ncbi:putative mediator of RNA polymerase II transcription subunit 28, partial [Bienertia sinuspersici]
RSDASSSDSPSLSYPELTSLEYDPISLKLLSCETWKPEEMPWRYECRGFSCCYESSKLQLCHSSAERAAGVEKKDSPRVDC